MRKIYTSDYIEVGIPVLLRISGPLPFDLYVQRGATSFTKIFNEGDPIDASRVKAYLEKKIEHFFVQQDQYYNYLSFVDHLANLLLANPKRANPSELKAIVQDLVDCTMFEVIQDTFVPGQVVNFAQKTVSACVELLNKDAKSFIGLLSGIKDHPYMLSHSISTSIYSLLIAKALEMGSQSTLQQLGTGALLHDIGMSRLTFDPETRDKLSVQEWAEVQTHPSIGNQLLENTPLMNDTVRSIILQHHEQPNGQGYPQKLKNQQIFLPAKIVAVADSFSALVSRRPYRKNPHTAKEALDLMESEAGKYDPKVLRIFGKLLGKKKQAA